VVEGARLESVYRGDSIVGSNPTVSATQLPDTSADSLRLGLRKWYAVK
jgi:hypothetical protein